MEWRMMTNNQLQALKALGLEPEILDFKKKQLQIQLELQKEFV